MKKLNYWEFPYLNRSLFPFCLPLSFLIYINDIGEKLLSLTRLFADDTSLGYSSSSPDTLELVIDHDLNKLSTWSEKWLMSFNPCSPQMQSIMGWIHDRERLCNWRLLLLGKHTALRRKGKD
jgi:hypothetical protein